MTLPVQLSLHRTMAVDEDGNLNDPVAAEATPGYLPRTNFDDAVANHRRRRDRR